MTKKKQKKNITFNWQNDIQNNMYIYFYYFKLYALLDTRISVVFFKLCIMSTGLLKKKNKKNLKKMW